MRSTTRKAHSFGATDQIIIALSGEQHVKVVGRAAAPPLMPESVVAGEAIQNVTAKTAIQLIAVPRHQ